MNENSIEQIEKEITFHKIAECDYCESTMDLFIKESYYEKYKIQTGTSMCYGCGFNKNYFNN